MAQRFLIVGGGFMGGHLAVSLAAAGESVSVISRSFNPWLLGRVAAEGLEIELIEATLPQSLGVVDELAGAFRDRDCVFHFAGGSTPELSAREPAAAVAEGLLPAVSVLDQARRAGCGRVVLASSGGTVYGRVGEVPTPETHPTEPQSLHGVTALALERYADHYRAEQGLETVSLRFSNIYGPGQRSRHGQGVIAAWCEALSRGERPLLIGDGSVRRDFLYASDAAAAAGAAMSAAPGIYNVGLGASVSLDEVLELLGEASGQSLDAVRKSGRKVDVAHTELDSTRFREATGWEPVVSIGEGIAETWRSMPRHPIESDVGSAD